LRTAIFILIFFFPALLFSQVKRPLNLPGYDDKTLHFGFSVGVNSMDLSIDRSMVNDLYPDVTKIGYGFQVQIVSDLRLSENLNLRFLPGISFGGRGLAFYKMSDSSLQNEMNIESSYLDFPLHIKYRADRLNNVRPYLMGGLDFRYDMSSKKSYNAEREVYIRLKPSDLYLEMGVGIDLYLQYFKFSPEIKISRGMFNTLMDDTTAGNEQYFNSINKLNAYIVMISFHFE
jgi:hypothetical protein